MGVSVKNNYGPNVMLKEVQYEANFHLALPHHTPLHQSDPGDC